MVKYYFDFTIINFVSHRYQWFVYSLFAERPELRGGRKLVYPYPIQLVTAPVATVNRMRETVHGILANRVYYTLQLFCLLVIIQKIPIVYIMMLVNNIIKTTI